MRAMKAFDGDEQLKQDLLAQVQASEDAGNIIHGRYGEFEIEHDDDWNAKIVGPWNGCAVGVIVHGNHGSYDTDFHGLPRSVLTALETVFEAQPKGNPDAYTYPRRLLEAIPVGADLSSFEMPFTRQWCESCGEYHKIGNVDFDNFLAAVLAAAN